MGCKYQTQYVRTPTYLIAAIILRSNKSKLLQLVE